MPERLSQHSVGQLGAALPVLHGLEEWLATFERAESIAGRVPKEMKEIAVGTFKRGGLQDQVTITLATAVHPDDRREHIESLKERIDTMRALIDEVIDPDDGSGPMFDAQDIELFHGLVCFIAKLASRSQREVIRFVEAMSSGDNAVLIMEYQCHGAGRPAGHEARFAPDLSSDQRAALKLRAPRASNARR